MNLFKSIVAVSSATMCCRVLGFIRDILVAKIFGVGLESDAFFVAFKLPSLLRRIFAEGAFTQAFVPTLVKYQDTNDMQLTKNFIASVYGALTLLLCLITTLGIIMAPQIVWLIAPGFIGLHYKFVLTSLLLRITFPYIIFISLNSFITGILNVWNYFIVPSYAPVVLHLSIIIFAIIFAKLFHPMILGLAWATILGSVIQIIYQLIYIKKIGILNSPKIEINREILHMLSNMGPGIISTSLNQITVIINTIFVSFLISGSTSWLYYADRLSELPSSIIGISFSTILLPLLAKKFNMGEKEEYSALIDWSLRFCIILALPSAIILGMLAGSIVNILFQHGKFHALDTIMTQRSLFSSSVGIIGAVLVRILTTVFYSQQDSKTPAKLAIITLIATQIMNLIFIWHLKYIGLSLSISLASCFNAALLYYYLRKKNIFKPQPGWDIFLMRLGLAVVAMITFFAIVNHTVFLWQINWAFWNIFRLITVCILGLVVYFSVLSLTGLRLSYFTQHFDK